MRCYLRKSAKLVGSTLNDMRRIGIEYDAHDGRYPIEEDNIASFLCAFVIGCLYSTPDSQSVRMTS